MAGASGPRSYVIIVEPEFGPDDAGVFPGLDVKSHGGQTMISGPVADQDELHEILRTLYARSLALVSIKRSEQPAGDR